MPASQYLALSDAEMELLDCKLAVLKAIKSEQRKRKLTTAKLAEYLELSRTDVEALLDGDSEFPLDAIALVYFQLDKTRKDFARAVQAETAAAWGVEPTQAGEAKIVRRVGKPSRKATTATTRLAA